MIPLHIGINVTQYPDSWRNLRLFAQFLTFGWLKERFEQTAERLRLSERSLTSRIEVKRWVTPLDLGSRVEDLLTWPIGRKTKKIFFEGIVMSFYLVRVSEPWLQLSSDIWPSKQLFYLFKYLKFKILGRLANCSALIFVIEFFLKVCKKNKKWKKLKRRMSL